MVDRFELQWVVRRLWTEAAEASYRTQRAGRTFTRSPKLRPSGRERMAPGSGRLSTGGGREGLTGLQERFPGRTGSIERKRTLPLMRSNGDASSSVRASRSRRSLAARRLLRARHAWRDDQPGKQAYAQPYRSSCHRRGALTLRLERYNWHMSRVGIGAKDRIRCLGV